MDSHILIALLCLVWIIGVMSIVIDCVIPLTPEPIMPPENSSEPSENTEEELEFPEIIYENETEVIEESNSVIIELEPIKEINYNFDIESGSSLFDSEDFEINMSDVIENLDE